MENQPGNNPYEGWHVISKYQPEIVPNARNPQPGVPNDFETTAKQFIGTEHYHADTGILLTDGVKWLLDAVHGYALLSFVRAHLDIIGEEEGAFVVIDLETDGTARIHDGRQPKNTLALDNLELKVPYKLTLYTGIFDRYLVLMLSGEY